MGTQTEVSVLQSPQNFPHAALPHSDATVQNLFLFFPASLSLFLPQQRITAAEFDKGRRLLQQCIAGVRLHFVAIIPAPVVCSIEKNKLNYTSYKEEKQLKKKKEKKKGIQHYSATSHLFRDNFCLKHVTLIISARHFGNLVTLIVSVRHFGNLLPCLERM